MRATMGWFLQFILFVPTWNTRLKARQKMPCEDTLIIVRSYGLLLYKVRSPYAAYTTLAAASKTLITEN
jgi:hypothetical protein